MSWVHQMQAKDGAFKDQYNKSVDNLVCVCSLLFVQISITPLNVIPVTSKLEK